MRNYAIIDLNKLKYNAKRIKSRLSNSKFCAVVKANGYGHGSVCVANAIYDIVDCFAVAIIEEGIELRFGGIDKDVLVLTPPQLCDIERAVEFGLTLSVCDIKTIKVLENECQKQGKKIKIHIPFNTGMNRFGIDNLAQLKEFLTRIKDFPHIIFDGVYSHFYRSENDAEYFKQIKLFDQVVGISKSFNKNAIAHISASGGFIRGAYYDMVRIGILLYGYKPFNCDFKVKPIAKLISPIVCKRRLKKGENALYGDNKLQDCASYNIVRYGYADGLFRAKTDQLINNRCMDISGYKKIKKYKGYAVVVDDCEKVAKAQQTICYEVLCSAFIRAEKIYIR